MFIKAVEIGSFITTAKFFSINSTTVGRKISNLEDSLGVKLIEKSNNSFYATPIGQKIIQQINEANFNLDQLQLLTKSIIYNDSAPGELYIALPPGIGVSVVSKSIHKFILANPKLHLNICYQNKEPELAKDNIDIAIVSHISQKHLNQKFKKIATFPVKFLCTQRYKEKYGLPQTPSELVNHQCVGLLTDNLVVRKTVKFTHKITDEVIEVQMPNNITTNSSMNNLEFINSDEMIAGIWDYKGFLPHYSHLVPVLTDYEADPISLYLLKHPYREDKGIDLLASFIEELFTKTS